jgi:hypothetical protein
MVMLILFDFPGPVQLIKRLSHLKQHLANVFINPVEYSRIEVQLPGSTLRPILVKLKKKQNNKMTIPLK